MVPTFPNRAPPRFEPSPVSPPAWPAYPSSVRLVSARASNLQTSPSGGSLTRSCSSTSLLQRSSQDTNARNTSSCSSTSFLERSPVPFRQETRTLTRVSSAPFQFSIGPTRAGTPFQLAAPSAQVATRQGFRTQPFVPMCVDSKRFTLCDDFTELDGFFAGGGDLLIQRMTVVQAKLKCRELPGCRGFCHRGPPTMNAVDIFFKNKWDNHVSPDSKWTSYKYNSVVVAPALPHRSLHADPKGEADLDILHDDALEWMWGDVGACACLSAKNPLRWSPAQSLSDTISDLNQLTSKDMKRPVNIVITRAGTVLREARFSTAAEMRDALQRAQVEPDPRWDDEGFYRWANQKIDSRHAIVWMKAGFVRECARRIDEGVRFPRRQELEQMDPDKYHLGAPPENVGLFYVSYASQVHDEADACRVDPKGFLLRDLAKVLKQEAASDDDLIFMFYSSLFLFTDGGLKTTDGRCVPRDSCTESSLYHLINDDFTPVLCYWRVKTILLPRIYEARPFIGHFGGTVYLNHLWQGLDLVLAAYCQRILTLKSDSEARSLIQEGTNPKRFDDLERLFLKELTTKREADRQLVWRLLTDTLRRMTPVRRDAFGFARFCDESQIAWLRVWYVKELSKRGGPFPRMQELRKDGVIFGAPHRGRKFVVSHGWETEVHPNPGGLRLYQLVEKLTQLLASDNDLVFLDFCSLPQEPKMGRCYDKDQPWVGAPSRNASAPAYFEANGSRYPDRTSQQLKRFGFAMWDMGRLYAFQECEVIVLPTLHGLEKPVGDRFPGGDVWGLVNMLPYKNRGWCCAEFSISLYCGNIKNLDDSDVQDVLRARTWPTTNETYAEMMRKTCKVENATDELEYNPEQGVDFTNRGDRAVVKYNFFKMALELKIMQRASVPWPGAQDS